MRDGAAAVLVAVSLLMAAWTAAAAALNRGVGVAQLAGLAAVELAVVGYGVVTGVELAGGGRPGGGEVGLLVGYLLTTLLVLPAAFSWAHLERSRWSTLVLTAACLVVAVLGVRMQQIWAVPA